jgi:hypothetical protein
MDGAGTYLLCSNLRRRVTRYMELGSPVFVAEMK